MPGAWNGWTNPPATNSVFGSATQVSGGKVTKITTGTTRWQTTIKVASSGGDITAGTYEFVYSSGPTGNPYNNKWGNVTVTMNSLQTYTLSGGASNNSITVTDGKWYVMNWKDNGYANTTAIFMELSGAPVTISSVTDNYSGAGNAVTVNITTSATPAAEEKIFVRYTKDSWSTSSFIQATGSGTSYSAIIPSGDVIGTSDNQYYVLTSTVSSPTHADADMQTINYNNNSGSNYLLPVELVSFSAKNIEKGIHLTWNTATETNNAGFEIERSIKDKSLWKKIAFIDGAGTSSSPKSYSYIDVSAEGEIEYRLKQIDRDGAFHYSNAVEVSASIAPEKYLLTQNFPNPFNPTTSISFAVAQKERVSIKIFNILGQEVLTAFDKEVEPNTLQHVTINASQLSSGIYFYALRTQNRFEVKKMTVMR